MMSSTDGHKPKPTKLFTSSKPTKGQEPLRESQSNNNNQHQHQSQQHHHNRPCDGECVSGLFALFCDELDQEAYCPNEGSCCVTSESSDVKDRPTHKTTTQKPIVTLFLFFVQYFSEMLKLKCIFVIFF